MAGARMGTSSAGALSPQPVSYLRLAPSSHGPCLVSTGISGQGHLGPKMLWETP